MMAHREMIFRPDLLRPVLKGRAAVHGLGTAVALLMAVIADLTPLLPAVAFLTTLLAVHQFRVSAIRQAWIIDMAYAVLLSYYTDSPIGLILVVGWAAAIGLVDTPQPWQLPVGVIIAAGGASVAWELGRGRSFVESAVAVFMITLVAVLFALVFRSVGRLLSRNDQELRSLFERVPVALVRTDPRGQLIEFNRATADMFDTPVIGENVTARYVDPAQRRSFVDKLMRDGVVQNHEVTFQVRPNETIEAVIAANAINDDSGKLRYIESAIYDFTSLRRTEVERERLARVIDSTSDLVALGNWDGTIRYANAAARNWMLEHVSDDEYTHMGQALDRDDFVRVRAEIQSEGAWAGLVSVSGRTGLRIVSVALQVIEIAGDYTVASISRDVTTEVETEQRLKELLRAKDELVASISHEIRTPLSVVLGMASELRDNYSDFDAETHQEFAGDIAEQGQEMANIVEDLLVAARTDPGSIVLVPDVVDLHHELDETTRLLPQHEHPQDLDNRANDVCWGDASRVRQILRNLIVNARRYGGEKIIVTTHSEGQVVYLYVADDGPGVPEGDEAMIFEPFERAHSSATQPASIGLGLSVSRDLARHMGGDLTYRRRSGQTVFTLSLPACSPDEN